jgi:hypothetical protein
MIIHTDSTVHWLRVKERPCNDLTGGLVEGVSLHLL